MRQKQQKKAEAAAAGASGGGGKKWWQCEKNQLIIGTNPFKLILHHKFHHHKYL